MEMWPCSRNQVMSLYCFELDDPIVLCGNMTYLAHTVNKNTTL